MRIQKLNTIDAFFAIDLDGVPGRGIVRLAPRILQGGAKDLARSITYTLASLGQQETGISAGINSIPEERDKAITAFVQEISDWDEKFFLSAGKGLTNEELGIEADSNKKKLIATSAVTAAITAVPKASTAVIENFDQNEDLIEQLKSKKIEVIACADPFTTEADLLFCGSKVGILDHNVAENIAVSAVIPIAPLPITARAIAHCQRRKIIALPDFVTTAGSVINNFAESEVLIKNIIEESLKHEDGPIIGACIRAEKFLDSWQTNLPFGRPMAS